MTLGILGRTDQKQQALRQIAASGGDYADEASYELGRSYIAQEKYAEGAAQLEKFVAAYPSSPRCTQALSDLGLAYLNLGDKQKSLKYYDRVIGAVAPLLGSQGRDAVDPRDLRFAGRRPDAYFDYAAKAGLESDLTALSRDSLFVRRGTETLPRRTAGGCREVAAQLCAELSEGVLPDRRALLFERLLPPLGERGEAIETLTALADRGTTQYTVAVLEKLSEMTYADERWDEAASAYRRLYDAAPTKTAARRP